MAVVRTSDPWGEKSSFENMTTQAKATVKQALGDAAKTVVQDIKDQTGIEQGQAQQAPQALQADQAKQADQIKKVEQEKQKNLNEIKSNLQRINQEIKQVRQERLQKEQQKKKEEKQEKQDKKQEEQKKDQVPFWKKMIRSGSREAGKKQGS